jgi:hypothetical protein
VQVCKQLLQSTGTATKGGFVEEAGKLVYKIGEGSKNDGPYSKEGGMLKRSYGYWFLKNVFEASFFGVDAHRGLDGMKNQSGRMATALQKKEELFGTPYEKEHFCVGTSFIERFIKDTDDNKRTATHDWKLYGKFFWTIVLTACAETGKPTFELFSK